jgi:hypothetical protein
MNQNTDPQFEAERMRAVCTDHLDEVLSRDHSLVIIVSGSSFNGCFTPMFTLAIWYHLVFN